MARWGLLLIQGTSGDLTPSRWSTFWSSPGGVTKFAFGGVKNNVDSKMSPEKQYGAKHKAIRICKVMQLTPPGAKKVSKWLPAARCIIHFKTVDFEKESIIHCKNCRF